MTQPATRFVTYLRVSTARQGVESASGSTPSALRSRRSPVSTGASSLPSHVEVESGKRSDRPELAKALAAAKKGKAVLLIAKLDRLARNVAFIANLMDAGADFVACDQLLASRLTLHILAAVAEDEGPAHQRADQGGTGSGEGEGVKLGVAPCGGNCSHRAQGPVGLCEQGQRHHARRNRQHPQVGGGDARRHRQDPRGTGRVRTPRGNTTWQPTQVARLTAACDLGAPPAPITIRFRETLT